MTRQSISDLARGSVLVFSDGYRTRQDQLDHNGIPILRVAEVTGSVLRPADGDRVSALLRSKMGVKTSRPGDVLVTTKGTVGRVAMVPSAFPEHVYSPQLCFLRVLDRSQIDPGWLYCWARSPEFLDQVGKYSGQTDMAPYLSLRDLGSIKIDVPLLDEQRRIARVLGALDDLIDLNRQLMQQILALSRAALTAAVRPDTPRVRLDSIAEVNPSRAPRADDSEVIYLAIADVKDGTITWPSITSWSEAPAAARLIGQKGDVIWSRVRPNRRSHALLPPATSNIVVSTGMVVLRPKGVSSAFLMAVCDTESFSNRLMSITAGTAYPTVDAVDFAQAEVPLISDLDRKKFDDVMNPLWDAFAALEDETRELSETRDELLPPLMSGRVQVGDVAA